jgi:hypothetical protein
MMGFDELLGYAAPIGAWLVTYLIHGTLLCAIAYLIARKLKERPEISDRLWKLALVGGLVTASVQMGTGVAPFGGALSPNASVHAPKVALLEAARRIPPIAVAAPVLSGVEGPAEQELARALAAPRAQKARARDALPAAGALHNNDVAAAPAAAPVVPAEAPAPGIDATATRAPAWLAAAVAVWLAGAALFGGMLFWAWASLRWRLRHRRPVGGRPAALLDRVAWRAGVRKPIQLSVTDGLDIPIAFGVLQPEISIPVRAAQTLSDEQLEALLAHECAHLIRRDPGWRLFASAIRSLFWIQPLNRVVCRQLESCAELCADDWAVEHTNRPLDLARCLTEVATWLTGRGTEATVPAMARPGSVLGVRVRRLVAGSGGGRRRPPVWLGAVAIVAIAGVGLAAPGASGSPSPEAPVLLAAAPATPAAAPVLVAGPGAPLPPPAVDGDAEDLGDPADLPQLAPGQAIDVSALRQLFGAAASRIPLDELLERLARGELDEDAIEQLARGAVGAWLNDHPEIDFDFDFEILLGDEDPGDDDGRDGLELFSPEDFIEDFKARHNRNHNHNHNQDCDVDVDVDVDLDDLDLDGLDAEIDGRVKLELERARRRLADACDGHEAKLRHRLERLAREAEQIRRHAHRARERALRHAERARAHAHQHAERARERALRHAERARARALRQAARALRDAERREGWKNPFARPPGHHEVPAPPAPPRHPFARPPHPHAPPAPPAPPINPFADDDHDHDHHEDGDEGDD